MTAPSAPEVLVLVPAPDAAAPAAEARLLRAAQAGWRGDPLAGLVAAQVSGPPARGLAAAALSLHPGPFLVDAREDRVRAATDLAFWLRAHAPGAAIVAACPGAVPPALAAACDLVAPDPGAASLGVALGRGWPDPARAPAWKPAIGRRRDGVPRLVPPPEGGHPLLEVSGTAEEKPSRRPAPLPPRPSAPWPPRPPDPLPGGLRLVLVQGPRPEGAGPCPESGSVAALLSLAGAELEVLDAGAGIPGRPAPTASGVAARLAAAPAVPVLVRASRGTASWVADLLHRARPPGPVICFGSAAAHSECRERISASGVAVSYVAGDAEPALLHAARALAARRPLASCPGLRAGGDGVPRPVPPADLDRLPFPTYAEWGLSRFGTASVLLGRGCDRRCLHCPDLAGARASRARSPAHLGREVTFLVETYGVGDLRFEDLALDSDLGALAGAADALASLPWPLRWTGRVSVREGLDAALLARLRASGCRALEVGLESASDGDLERLEKGFTAAAAAALIHRVHEAGIECRVGLSVGLPGADDDDLQATRDFLLAHREAIAGVSRVGPVPLLAASRLGAEPGRLGVTLGGPGFRERWFDRGYNNHSFRRKRVQQFLRWLRQEGIPVGGP